MELREAIEKVVCEVTAEQVGRAVEQLLPRIGEKVREQIWAELSAVTSRHIADDLPRAVRQVLPDAARPIISQLVREEVDWYLRHDRDITQLLRDQAWDLVQRVAEEKYPVKYAESKSPDCKDDPVEGIIKRIEQRLIEMICDRATPSSTAQPE
jgi:hypothetical protein